MSKDVANEKPERPGHNGQEEMEALFVFCKKKRLHIGALVKPMRTPDQLRDDKDHANLVLIVSAYHPTEENIVFSDEVTESLSVSAKFLLEEVKTFNG